MVKRGFGFLLVLGYRKMPQSVQVAVTVFKKKANLAFILRFFGKFKSFYETMTVI